jgi:hypothetical protein
VGLPFVELSIEKLQTVILLIKSFTSTKITGFLTNDQRAEGKRFKNPWFIPKEKALQNWRLAIGLTLW